MPVEAVGLICMLLSQQRSEQMEGRKRKGLSRETIGKGTQGANVNHYHGAAHPDPPGLLI